MFLVFWSLLQNHVCRHAVLDITQFLFAIQFKFLYKQTNHNIYEGLPEYIKTILTYNVHECSALDWWLLWNCIFSESVWIRIAANLRSLQLIKTRWIARITILASDAGSLIPAFLCKYSLKINVTSDALSNVANKAEITKYFSSHMVP